MEDDGRDWRRVATRANGDSLTGTKVFVPDGVAADVLLVTARTDALEPAMEVLMAARLQGRYSVEDLRVERMTLEDVFLHVTGRRMRD